MSEGDYPSWNGLRADIVLSDNDAGFKTFLLLIAIHPKLKHGAATRREKKRKNDTKSLQHYTTAQTYQRIISLHKPVLIKKWIGTSNSGADSTGHRGELPPPTFTDGWARGHRE